MGLVLSVKPGDAFFVGRRRIVVAAVSKPAHVTIERDDGLTCAVGSHAWTQVFKDVFLCVGKKTANGYVRLVFSAPQTILILRDAN
jgi:hypothetical protein